MQEKPEQAPLINSLCSNCETSLCICRSHIKCDICGKFKQLSWCRNCSCWTETCLQCETLKPSLQKTDSGPKSNDGKLLSPSAPILSSVIILLGAIMSYYLYFMKSSDLKDLTNIEGLRKQFPSQKNETWYHILSVLDHKVPTVKSVTLLYKNNRKTSDCLAKELVNVFSRGVKVADVSFDLGGIQYRDYGEVLEYYHTVVKSSRVLITDLNVVPSDIAKAFHSLCDEVSSDIKPSLFIFMLRWNEEMAHLKPLERATAILRKAWSDLPDSDLFPLLSRIVKNVVDIVPEKQGKC